MTTERCSLSCLNSIGHTHTKADIEAAVRLRNEDEATINRKKLETGQTTHCRY